MFSKTPKPIQIALSISLITVCFGMTAVSCGFAWKSLSSDDVNLQIANENLKISAKLNETRPEIGKAQIATNISRDLVMGITQSAKEERKALTQELLAELKTVQGSYCSNQLNPLKEKIEAIEAKSVLSPETEKALETAEKTLADASSSLKKLEEETEQEIKKKEEKINKIEKPLDLLQKENNE